MKYIIFCVLFLLSIVSYGNSQSITLTASSSGVDINTTFGLTVQVDGLSNPGEVQIQGVDKFTVRGQTQSTSMQLNNGQQSLQVQLQLQLQPTTSGSFTIGPARIMIGTGAIESNILTIDVTGEKLFLQPQQVSTLLGVQEEQASPEESDYPISSIPVAKSGFPRWRLIFGGCILACGWFFWTTSKNRNNKSLFAVKKEIFPNKQQIVLPQEEDERFRQFMDTWRREQLSNLTKKDCCALTFKELFIIVQGLSPYHEEIFLSAFTVIQNARYADAEGDRTCLHDLALRFTSSLQK